MPAFSAHAPGKAILLGEHAVVYGYPAIAVPVSQVQARATVLADLQGPTGRIWIDAPSVDINCDLQDLAVSHPLRNLFHVLQDHLKLSHYPALRLRITSTIPVAAGLGSGAAVSAAVIQALSAFLGHRLDKEKISTLTFEVERFLHGNPSGIDNTVVTYEKPIFFIRNKPFEFLKIPRPFQLIIADTGIRSTTADAVANVRSRWQENPEYFNSLFRNVGTLVEEARLRIETGQIDPIGELMNLNHAALKEMGVSCPELDTLVETARQAGALGAKLSGGGQGGNMIALAPAGQEIRIKTALASAGAVNIIITTVQ
jgi:mevalonate kinase